MNQKSTPLTLTLALLFLITIVLAACTSPPESLPTPPPEPREPPPEEPAPEPEPLGHAPLVGTRWTLLRVYGDMRRLTPQERDVWVEFQAGDSAEAGASTGSGAIVAQGPQNPVTGRYSYRVDETSPRDSIEFEEGVLTGEEIVRQRAAGSYSELEDAFLENLQLLKGYYISGESPEDSTLTIWGGFRSEEVVLLEFVSEPTTP